MKIISTTNNDKYVNLKLVTRILANKYLPVWIMTNENNDGLKLVPEIMNQLGEFTTYQDAESTSAAIYYHRHREFNGIIDYRYLIQRLSIDHIDWENENEFLLEKSVVVNRKISIGHSQKKKRKHEGSMTQKKMKKKQNNKIIKDQTGKIKTIRNAINRGNLEILVVISWEMAQELINIEEESEKYTSIVSYVLTLFNSVDMLYSKLKKTNIQLNIAGIIIGTDCESFSFLKKCYISKSVENSRINRRKMNTKCVLTSLYQYLFDRRHIISINSYDFVIFLTRNHLRIEKQIIKGLSQNFHNKYQRQLSNSALILISTVQDLGDFESYPTVAHEISHLMSVKHDQSSMNDNEKCHSYIMKPFSEWCENCLSWSEASENSFETFFNSPDCCKFINEPRSLHPPGPRLILTANEQCQCYKYESAVQLSLRDDIYEMEQYCVTHLKCKGKDGAIYNTPIPMDGTPCGGGGGDDDDDDDDNKVCWDYRCVSFRN